MPEKIPSNQQQPPRRRILVWVGSGVITLFSGYFLQPLATDILTSSGLLQQSAAALKSAGTTAAAIASLPWIAWSCGIIIGVVLGTLWQRYMPIKIKRIILRDQYFGLPEIERRILLRLDTSTSKRLLFDTSCSENRIMIDGKIEATLSSLAEEKKWISALLSLESRNIIADITGRGEVYQRI